MIPRFKERYLERIGLDPLASYPVNATTLALLQEAHVRTVPYEIIDTIMGCPADLSPEGMFDKIVIRRRGGFCYEVNGLFALLLEELGFQVERLAALVPVCGAKGDHILMRVTIDGEAWLTDVGFRTAPLVPIRFIDGLVQDGVKADYRIELAPDDEAYTFGFGKESRWLTRRLKGSEEWTRMFRFDDEPYTLEGFEWRCIDFETNEDSHFLKRPSISTEHRAGEKYLNDSIFVNVVGDELVQRDVKGRGDFVEILMSEFSAIPWVKTGKENPGLVNETLGALRLMSVKPWDGMPKARLGVVNLGEEGASAGSSLRSEAVDAGYEVVVFDAKEGIEGIVETVDLIVVIFGKHLPSCHEDMLSDLTAKAKAIHVPIIAHQI